MDKIALDMRENVFYNIARQSSYIKMLNVWQLQSAKNRLSQVVDEALEKGPQTITLRGKPAVVVLSVEDYRKLCQAGGSLFEFLSGSPLRGVDLDVTRSRDTGRDAAL